MKNLWLFVFVILSFSCSKPRNSYDHLNLKGKVWKIQQSSYEGIEKNGEYEIGDNNYSGFYQYVFNESGNLIEFSDHYEDGDIYEIRKYNYNEDDLCTEIIHYEDEDEDDINLREVGILVNGKVSGWKVYNADEELVHTVNYTLVGDLISAVEGEVINEEDVEKYSYENEFNKGQLVKQTVYDNEGDISSVATYERNSNQDIVKTHHYYPKDTTNRIYKSEYEYDEVGNWIRQNKFDEVGLIDEIIIREIEYYKKSNKTKGSKNLEGVWFVILTDDDWFDEDDWMVIETNSKFDIGYDEEIWKSGTWESDKKQALLTLRSDDDDDSKKYKYHFEDNCLVLSTLSGVDIVKFEKR